MPYKRGYIKDDRPVTCDICGFTYRYSEMRKGISGKQKGLVVCPADYDDIHPRDIKVTKENERNAPEVR